MCLEQETWALLPATRHTRLTGPTMPRGPPGSVRGAILEPSVPSAGIVDSSSRAVGLSHGMSTELEGRRLPAHRVRTRLYLLRARPTVWPAKRAAGTCTPGGPPLRHYARVLQRDCAGAGATEGSRGRKGGRECTFPFLQGSGAQRALPHPELAVMSAETPGPKASSYLSNSPASPTYTWASSGLPRKTAPTAPASQPRRGTRSCRLPLPCPTWAGSPSARMSG